MVAFPICSSSAICCIDDLRAGKQLEAGISVSSMVDVNMPKILACLKLVDKGRDYDIFVSIAV